MLTSLLLMMSLGASNERWTRQSDHDGIRLETRSVQGSSFEEIRATTASPHPVAALCGAIWDGNKGALEAGFKKRQVLKETPTERWTYEQIATPLVSDRDYTLHVRRTAGPDGACQISFETENSRGPPPQSGVVRIPAIRGIWDIQGLKEGGSRIVYTIYSEPGGSLPAFLTRRCQRSSAVDFLKRILSRLGTHG